MKEIGIKEMKVLLDNDILRNSNRGFINKRGEIVSFYRSKHKRYIEDYYSDKARQLIVR